MIPTKSQIQTTNKIKVDPDNFSWCIFETNTFVNDNGDGVLRLKCMKTAKYKKLYEINEMDKQDEDYAPMNIDESQFKNIDIVLKSINQEDQIFFSSNVKNLCDRFTDIINIIKNE